MNIETRPIKLKDGWLAVEVVETDGSGLAPSLGTRDRREFHDFLRKLVTDANSLDDVEVLKYSETVRVLRAKCQCLGSSTDVICKQSLGHGRWRKFFGATREKKNFYRGMALMNAGITTARPLAYAECHKGPHQAWLVTEYVTGLFDLERVASDLLPRLPADRRTTVRRTIIYEVAQLFRKLEEGRFHHRDLKASNILVQSWDGSNGPPRVFLVDLDGLSHRPLFRQSAWRQRIVRLTASFEGHSGVTRTDRWRFLSAILAPNATHPTIDDRNHMKKLYRTIATGAAKYDARARSRKTNKLEGV